VIILRSRRNRKNQSHLRRRLEVMHCLMPLIQKLRYANTVVLKSLLCQLLGFLKFYKESYHHVVQLTYMFDNVLVSYKSFLAS